MLCDFPYEWRQYMVKGKVRTFRDDTPKEIIEQAKKINEKAIKYEGEPYFHFLGDSNN